MANKLLFKCDKCKEECEIPNFEIKVTFFDIEKGKILTYCGDCYGI